MVRLSQLAFSLLHPFTTWNIPNEQPLSLPQSDTTKSIAIIGAGSAGLGTLKAFLDLPDNLRAGWDIVLFEQRAGVGGIWLPDPHPLPKPPNLPETPLYPRLRTNTPVPAMTYPGFPFPPGTPLYPGHEHIQKYHADYASHYNLTSHIRLNHTVVAANWVGTPDAGAWDIIVRNTKDDISTHRRFDHLVVGIGHNHYPHTPSFNGTDAWLAYDNHKEKREILHSIYYRSPDRYANRTVLIIGGGASGRDAGQQIVPVAKMTYQSVKPSDIGSYPGDAAVRRVPLVSHFNSTSVVLADGSALHDVDVIILATGYELRAPFLSAPHSSVLDEVPLNTTVHEHANSTTAHVLTTNLRYLFPLYEHIFSLSRNYPPTALAFIGLPIGVANCPADRAQALLTAHAIADPSILNSREELVDELVEREEALRAAGEDPYIFGHRLTLRTGMAEDYQDRLINRIRAHGNLPPGLPYTKPWRRWAGQKEQIFRLRRAWIRVEELGEAEVRRWVANARTEEEWVDVMERMAEWQKEWERENEYVPSEFEEDHSLYDY